MAEIQYNDFWLDRNGFEVELKNLLIIVISYFVNGVKLHGAYLPHTKITY